MIRHLQVNSRKAKAGVEGGKLSGKSAFQGCSTATRPAPGSHAATVLVDTKTACHHVKLRCNQLQTRNHLGGCICKSHMHGLWPAGTHHAIWHKTRKTNTIAPADHHQTHELAVVCRRTAVETSRPIRLCPGQQDSRRTALRGCCPSRRLKESCYNSSRCSNSSSTAAMSESVEHAHNMLQAVALHQLICVSLQEHLRWQSVSTMVQFKGALVSGARFLAGQRMCMHSNCPMERPPVDMAMHLQENSRNSNSRGSRCIERDKHVLRRPTTSNVPDHRCFSLRITFSVTACKLWCACEEQY
jgi:hypothetical protein